MHTPSILYNDYCIILDYINSCIFKGFSITTLSYLALVNFYTTLD